MKKKKKPVMDLGLTRAQKIQCVSEEEYTRVNWNLRAAKCKGHTEEGHLNTVTQGVVWRGLLFSAKISTWECSGQAKWSPSV